MFAQEPTESETDEIIDDLLGEDEIIDDLLESTTNFSMLYASVNYNSDTYFSGRDIGTDQFNIIPQLTYMHSKGFFASISGLYYSEFTPKWDYTSLAVGYGKSFGKDKKFRWSASYTRYFYAAEVDNPFKNGLTALVAFNNKKRNFGTLLSTTYLFGDDNSYQLASTTYGAIQLFKNKEEELKLRPQLSFLVGKQTIEQARVVNIGSSQVTRYIQNNEFGLLNTQLNIPIQYSVKSLDLELGYTLNIPSKLPGENNLSINGFFNFSMAYMFTFD
ncbi:hypothetical protein WH52_03050 [Tenacibaculum holothuriorum]|uniref:Uncharacterized protein n=1 Tax=Tenacibaculum holothuriorum TaxID=1635173 RepID=A0A1Y2PER6_9FLAO|nr:hypothetical protein [Tenacibaculum holothuriorum]OSY88670.1 hypothetical protein WH52_03050 [Tenacibaculum holothuriorum]